MCRTLKKLIDGDNITNFVVILFFSAGFSMGIFGWILENDTAVGIILGLFFGLWGGSIVVMFSWVGLCKLIKGV